MKYSQAKTGRTFILRLEHGEVIHETIEKFAIEIKLTAATVILLGGADKGSKIVVGPENTSAKPILPMEYTLEDVHEIAGLGTIFKDSKGKPILHMHSTFGRGETAHTGCIRRGVKVWCFVEAVIQEITNTKASRKLDASTGFEILEP